MAKKKFNMTIEKAEALISACECEIEEYTGVANVGIDYDLIAELKQWIKDNSEKS